LLSFFSLVNQVIECRISNLEFQILNLEFQISDIESRISNFESRMILLGFHIIVRNHAYLLFQNSIVSIDITASSTLNLTFTYSLLSLGRYLCWWTISPWGYHPPSSQCFYHWVDTSAGELLVPEGIIRLVVSVTITGSIPLLVNY
jgi:hypothetical protein